MRYLSILGATGALLALAGCQALAYRSATRSLLVAPPPMDHGLDAQVLPSGLRLAVFQVPGQRDVTVTLALGGGRSDEPEGKAGVAQVAARAAMVAPRSLGGGSILERLYASGALFTASVSQDETTVSVRYRPAYQAQVASALADLIADPAAGVDEQAVRLARDEALAELERTALDPRSAVAEARRLALAGTPFGRPSPTAEGLASLTVQDVRAFLRASYAPPRAVLWFASGKEAEPEAARIVQRLGARVTGDPGSPSPPAAGYQADPPPTRLPTREVTLTGGTKPRVLLAWPSPGYRYWPAASRAGSELREALGRRTARPDLAGKVRWVNVSLESFDRASVLAIEAVLERPEDLEVVRTALVDASRKPVSAWGWSGAAGEAALRRDLRMDRERSMAYGWVGPVGRLVRATGSADVPAWLDLNEPTQFGPAARAWADAWITPGPAVVATVTPIPDATALSGVEAGGAEAVPPIPEGAASVWITAPSLISAAVPGPQEIDVLLEPAGLEAAQREVLPNGIEALVLRRPGAPFAFAKLWLPGGAARAFEGLAADQAVGEARTDLVAGGCELAPAAQRHADGVSVRLSGPTAWLPAVIEAVACWGLPLSAPRARLPSPDEATPWLAVEAALTGGPLPSPAGGKAWSEAYLRRLGQTEGALIVMVGDLEPAATLAQLREAFGRFPRRAAAPSAGAADSWPRVRRVILEDLPGAKDASATLYLRLPDSVSSMSGERWVLSSLLTDLAQRTFGPSGLEARVRWAMNGQAQLEKVSLSGGPARLPAAMAELLRELQRLRDRGPSPVELEVARWNSARDLAYRHDAAPGAADGLDWLAQEGLPLDTWNGFGARLRQVSPATLQALVRSAAVGAESILLRGDAATLVPLLRKEGFTPEVLAPPAPPRAADMPTAR
jgi:predicted Zn-dependent peptidase